MATKFTDKHRECSAVGTKFAINHPQSNVHKMPLKTYLISDFSSANNCFIHDGYDAFVIHFHQITNDFIVEVFYLCTIKRLMNAKICSLQGAKYLVSPCLRLTVNEEKICTIPMND